MKLLSSLHSYNITGVLKQNISLLKYLRDNMSIETLVIGPKRNLGIEILEEEGFVAEITSEKSVDDILHEHDFLPDFVLSESLFSQDLTELSDNIGAKHMIRIHEEIPSQPGKGLWLSSYKPVNEYFQNFRNSKIIFPSSHTANYYQKQLQEFNLDFEVIHGSVDEENLNNLGEALRFSDFQILQLGTVYERKGGINSLEGFFRFLNKEGVEDANLVFAGARNANEKEIQYTKKLKNRARELGIEEKVKIYDSMKNPYPLIKGSSIMTLHSYSECFPTVFLEAMYFGKVIVSSNVGGISEQVYDGITGYLFDVGDIDKQATLFSTVFNERGLSESKSKIIKNRYLDYFSQKSCGEKFLKILEHGNNK